MKPKGIYEIKYPWDDVRLQFVNTTDEGNIILKKNKWVFDPPLTGEVIGVGDMLKSMYDPRNIEKDSFDMGNMSEGTNAKILTAAERIDWNSKAPGVHTHVLASITDAGSMAAENVWKGTQDEYDALGSYDNDTIYLIEGALESTILPDNIHEALLQANNPSVSNPYVTMDEVTGQAWMSKAVYDTTDRGEDIFALIDDNEDSIEALFQDIKEIAGASVSIYGEGFPLAISTSVTTFDFGIDIPSTNTEVIEVDAVNNLINVKKAGTYFFNTAVAVNNATAIQKVITFNTINNANEAIINTRQLTISTKGDNIHTPFSFAAISLTEPTVIRLDYQADLGGLEFVSIKTSLSSATGGQAVPGASEVAYDNTTSGLAAEDVQGAIDEHVGNMDRHLTADEKAGIAGVSASDPVVKQSQTPLGVRVYETYSTLPATGELLFSYKVSNDPDNSLNGYYHWTGSAYLKDSELDWEKADTLLRIGKVDIILGKNRFNKNSEDIVDGKYLDSSGSEATNATYFISHYILVDGSIEYTASNFELGVAYGAYYDSNKTLISTFQGSMFTTPSNAAYVRLSGTLGSKDSTQLEIGNTATDYVEYTEYAPVLDLELNKASLIQLQEKLTAQYGKNLFNKDDENVVLDKFFGANGILTDLVGYFVSGFIPVKPETEYTVTAIASNSGGARNLFYAINKETILDERQGTSIGSTFTTPVDCYWLRLSGGSKTLIDIAQIELGNTATSYEKFYDYYPLKAIEDEFALTDEKIANKLDKEIGKNLFNKDSQNIIDGKYLGPTGSENSNALYFISDYMPVEEGETYYHSNFNLGGAYLGVYDANKVHIAGNKDLPLVIPVNGAFVRMSGTIAKKDIQQFEKGSTATSYEPYTEFAPVQESKNQQYDEDPYILLPKQLYFVKDFESCIYYENVLTKNLNDAISAYFNEGYNYNRLVKLQFDAAAIGQSMTAQIARALKKGVLSSFVYDVIDSAVNNGKTLNVLRIGDSFTDIGTWLKEVDSLLAAAGVTVNSIGTCGDETFRAEGLSGGTLANTFLDDSAGVARRVQVTGVTELPATTYPGTTYQDDYGDQWTIRSGKIDGSGNGHIVVTKFGAVESDFDNFPASGNLTRVDSLNKAGDAVIAYTNAAAAYFNPFINPSSGLLDITNYITTWGFNAPNQVHIQFTWNDLGTIWDSKVETVVQNFIDAADHIHAAYPSCKLIYSIEPYGSPNGDRDWNGKKFTVFTFIKRLIEVFEDDPAYNSWLKIAPSYAFVDMINGYSTLQVSPCARYQDITERSGGDGVHPTGVGMQQIGDCVYQVSQYLLTL